LLICLKAAPGNPGDSDHDAIFDAWSNAMSVLNPVAAGDLSHPVVKRPSWIANNWGLLLAVAALVAILLLPTPAGLPIAGHRMLAILAFAVVVWMTEALDYAVSAVVIAALMAFLLGTAPNPANPNVLLGTSAGLGLAFGGFANTALALVASALFLAAAMSATGLDKRIALVILARVGTETRHVIAGSILVGIVIAFLVPSTTARVSCLVPIMLGIIAAFGVNRRGAFAGMLMITTTQTASIWNVGIKTAAAQNMVAVGFIEKTLQKIHHLARMADRRSAVRYRDVHRALFRDDAHDAARDQGGARRPRGDPQGAGRPRSDEDRRKEAPGDFAHAARVLVHGRSPAQLRHQHHDGRRCRAHVPAGHRHHELEAGSAHDPVGHDRSVRYRHQLGAALLQTKGAVWIADLIVVEFGLKQATALFILGVMSLFLILIHLGFASATALASAMIPIIIAVLQGVETPGINILGMTMVLQFVVSFGFILVVNAPQNMVAYGTETFEARDFVRTGLVLTVVAFALVMLLGATYWRWLGYV
jgi:di/tricarboxylate transporter